MGALSCLGSFGDQHFKQAPTGAGAGAGKKRKSTGGAGASKKRKSTGDAVASPSSAPLTAKPIEGQLNDLTNVHFVVLCSDGVHEKVSPDEIVSFVAAHVASGKPRADAASALLRLATQRCAFEHRLSTQELWDMQVGGEPDRRDYCDDMSAVIIFLQ